MTKIAESDEKMLAMNEALLLGSLRQHELTDAADVLNAKLQTEIAERKQAEKKLRESEERYRNLFNSIDEGFCVIEKVEGGPGAPPDFLYLEANPAFMAQSGMKGMVGKTIRQALPDEPEGWCSIYDTVLRTGEPIRFERGLVTHGRVLELYAFRVEDETYRRVAVIFKDITGRKQAEEAFARLAAIVESSDDAIISKDLNGVIRSWNKGAGRLFGYTAQEAIGQPMTLLFPPDRLHEEAEILGRLKRGERVDHFETTRVRKDGSPLEISLTISPIKDAEGQVIGASKIARDIGERKRAEETLRASEENFRTLFASAPVAVFVCDRNAVIQQYNNHAVELWGREPERGVEQHCGSVKLWLPDGTLLPHPQSPIMEVLRTGIPALNIEVFIERPDGSRVPVLVSFAAMRDAQGEITGAVTSFVDISARKLAEERARNSLARFQVLADNMPALCWMANADGWIFWFNRRWYEYTGTTLQSQQGWGWQSVHDPEALPAVTERWKMSIATGQPFEMVFPLKGADGVFRPFLTRIVPLRDEEGRVVQWFGTNTDITSERKAEERQQLLMNELAHRGNNLLAVIQSIASRTLSGNRSLSEAHEVLSERIQALARSQSALMNEGFEGALVAEIIRLEFASFSDRVKADGPDVMLNPRVAQTFALLLHELATNAAKYGALSRPEGRLAVQWSIVGRADEPARFRFQWQERGGPPVAAPTRQGFGRMLLEKAAAQDFGAQPKINFAPEGLAYEIEAPLSVVGMGRS